MSPEEFYKAAKSAGLFVFDLETTGLNPREDRIEGLALYVPPINKTKKIRAWYPFVPRTIEVKLYACNKCGWSTYDEQECNLDESRPIPVFRCKECNKKVKIKKKDLRPPMDQEDIMERFRPMFEDESLVAIGHNLKFDVSFLYFNPGTELPIDVRCKIADSQIANYLQNENHRRYGLKVGVERVFGHKMTSYNEATSNDGVFSFVMQKSLGCYAMDDCEWTYKLFDWSINSLRNQDPEGRLEKIFWDLEMKITRIIIEMETTGVKIDWKWLVEVSNRLMKQKADCQKIIDDLAGKSINLNSQQQVSDFMFNPPDRGGIGLPTHGLERGKSGYWPTDDKTIKFFARKEPAVDHIRKYRSLDTIQSSFSDKLIKLAKVTGRIYSQFLQTGTKIGRLSSAKPVNLQNQPREKNLIRRAFCARLPDEDLDMCLVSADFGQIELRVVAHLANELNMIEVYNSNGICTAGSNGLGCDNYRLWHECKDEFKKECEWKGHVEKGQPCPECGSSVDWLSRCRHVDLHQRTAEDVGVKRNPLAKNLNFGALYRIGPRRFIDYADLYDEHGNAMIDEASAALAGWYNAYPNIPIFHHRVEQEVRNNGWIAYTLTRRRRRLAVDAKLNDYRAVTQAIQFAVSGTAQDIMKIAMIRIWEAIQRKIRNSPPAEAAQWRRVKFILQVHDEITLQCPVCIAEEVKEIVETEMCSAANLKVPLKADAKIGVTWDDVH